MQLTDKIPDLVIPVKVEPKIDFPALTSGPVRVDGATLPITISISDVIAASNGLWVSIALKPGDITKTADAGPSAEPTKKPATTPTRGAK
jgi:hypothetical protein